MKCTNLLNFSINTKKTFGKKRKYEEISNDSMDEDSDKN